MKLTEAVLKEKHPGGELRCNTVDGDFTVTVHQKVFYALTRNRTRDSVKITRLSSPAQETSAQVCGTTLKKMQSKNLFFLQEATLARCVLTALLLTDCRTRWFDHDDPTGNGDYEILSDLLSMYPGEICPQPTAVEVQTISGQPASNTSDTFLK